MAKAEAKENIKDLSLLQREFERGMMEDRKLIALRQKLIDLHIAGTSNPGEHNLLVAVLKRDRLKGRLEDIDANMEILNRIEVEKATEKAYVKIDHPPRVHHLTKNKVCKFFKDNDTDKFVVYVEITIPATHQMTEELIYAEMRGHFKSPDEYPKPKVRLQRLDLQPREFHAWFNIISDDDLAPTKREEVYTF